MILPSKLMILSASVLALSSQSASAGSSGCKLKIMATLPVSMVGAKPTVTTQINGADATFMVDSGAFYSIITPGSAAQFGLRLQPLPFGFNIIGIGGRASVQVATVKKFGVVGQTLPNVQFLVGGSEIGNDHGGVLGENILGIADTEYDLAKGVVRLIRTEGCSRASFPFWVKTEPFSEIDIDVSRYGTAQRVIGAAYLNGIKLRVQFDTGASASLITRSAAKRAGIDINSPGATSGGLSSGFGKQTVRTWIVPVASFKIGGEEIRKTKL
ncbi:MAG: retropepsin-like domain-containing protein, partial [Pseudomonadota bacterium]|nr:retropepsin-like domain-containing protein [Pseudomonadota bacterium]